MTCTSLRRINYVYVYVINTAIDKTVRVLTTLKRKTCEKKTTMGEVETCYLFYKYKVIKICMANR